MRPASFLYLVATAWLVGSAALGYAHDAKLPQHINELSLSKIGESVYVVHGIQGLPDSSNKGFISNTGIILTRNGVVIIDSGGSTQIAQLIVSKLRPLTKKPVIAVFNTHIHGDHWLGNAAIREAYPGAQIFAHKGAIERLKNGEADRWLRIFMKMTKGAINGTRAVLPDHGLAGDETLVFGGMSFKVHHTGHAHTDSDIMIEVPDNRLLFTGDIVEYGRAVSSDVPADFNILGQIRAIEYALKLPVNTFVPGHGISGGPQIAREALQFLRTIHGSVKRYYLAGLKDYEMRDNVAKDLSEFSGWFGMDQLGRLISHIYLQVEEAEFR